MPSYTRKNSRTNTVRCARLRCARDLHVNMFDRLCGVRRRPKTMAAEPEEERTEHLRKGYSKDYIRSSFSAVLQQSYSGLNKSGFKEVFSVDNDVRGFLDKRGAFPLAEFRVSFSQSMHDRSPVHESPQTCWLGKLSVVRELKSGKLGTALVYVPLGLRIFLAVDGQSRFILPGVFLISTHGEVP